VAQEGKANSPFFKPSGEIFESQNDKFFPWSKESGGTNLSAPSAGLDLKITKSDLLQAVPRPSTIMKERIRDFYCKSHESVREGSHFLASETTSALLELENHPWAKLAVDFAITWGEHRICPPPPPSELNSLVEGYDSLRWKRLIAGLIRLSEINVRPATWFRLAARVCTMRTLRCKKQQR
jgi:hypothetical protein